ncbi:hypothetical protein QQX98_004173 [Neonectria punicea]|uniref:CBM-cenC domain-containing protein n=1 Tax=Neonectria punicea TaxID=979145 RepID=A0ABR1HAI1_9HYPO
MVSQKLVAAFTAFSLLVGSGASPCKPSSSDSDVATTTTSLSVIETSSTSIETVSTSNVSTTTDVSTTTEAATSTTSTAPAVETLALQNGGFDITPASYAPWTVYAGIAATISLDDTKFQAGSRSLSMRSAASDWVTVVQVLDKTQLVANMIYRFSLYAQVSSASKCSDGVYIWIDDNNMQHAVGPNVHGNAGDMEGTWKYIEGDYTFSEAALTGANDIRVVVKSRCGNGYSASIDSAELAFKYN